MVAYLAPLKMAFFNVEMTDLFDFACICVQIIFSIDLQFVVHFNKVPLVIK